MTPDRAERVADFIRGELADIVRTRMRDPRASLVTVTDARVSRDLGVADVYVTSMDAEDASAQGALVDVLNGAAGFLRSMLSQRHSMRTTPRLRFHYDELIEGGPRLEALIDRARDADRSLGHPAQEESLQRGSARGHPSQESARGRHGT